MRSTPATGRRLATALLVAGGALAITLATAPAGFAEPDAQPPANTAPGPAADSSQPAPLAADPNQPAPAPDGGAPAPSEIACKSFSQALNFAAANYEDFAYDSAGTGNAINYADPNVQNSNVTGRTALRQAAGTAMDAANTPGLQPDISAPMRSWSLRATKLLLVMGLRGGGDRLNTTATNMNEDARAVQMTCAAAGTAV